MYRNRLPSKDTCKFCALHLLGYCFFGSSGIFYIQMPISAEKIKGQMVNTNIGNWLMFYRLGINY